MCSDQILLLIRFSSILINSFFLFDTFDISIIMIQLLILHFAYALNTTNNELRNRTVGE